MILKNSRLLEWDACLNARELGGYSALDGRRLRWRTLVRSDNSANLSPAGVQALVDYGVRTVIDLRFASELEQSPSPLAQLPSAQVTYLNIPLDEDQNLRRTLLATPALAMSDLYVRLLETNRGHVAAVLGAIAQAPAGGVMFHCHAGKDRTGLITACILGMFNVPQDMIANDYAFSTPQAEARRKNYLANPEVSAEERAYLEVQTSAWPETMQRTLRYLEERYGSVAGYVRTTPLPEDALGALQARLLEG